MIKEIIYNYFKEKEKYKSHYDINDVNFSPHDCCDCRRKIWYKRTNFPEDPITNINTHGDLKTFLGDLVHDGIQKILTETGVLIEHEKLKEIEKFGFKWKYKLDGIVNPDITISNNEWIIEIKSKWANGFYKIEYEPDPNNLIQLYLYMIFENKSKGTILYIGRDNGRMIEYEYHNINELKNIIEIKLKEKLKELTILKEQIEKGIMPKRDYQIQIKSTGSEIPLDKFSEEFQYNNVKYKSDWQCDPKYCRWRYQCWKSELEEIKYNSYYINGKFIPIKVKGEK